MKKNIIVINSPVFEKNNPNNKEDYLPPLGLGVIVSALENKYNVKFIDALADDLGVEDIIAILVKENVKYVCINIFTTNYNLVKQIVEQTKAEIHWIIGGISTKSLYKEIFNWDTENHVDVVFGDGELIVENIIDSTVLESPNDYRENRRFFIIYPTSKYYVSKISGEIINRRIFKYEPHINIYNEYEVCIYTSRGCTYSCAYCVAAHNRNKELGNIRLKNVNSIVSELENINKSYSNVVTIRILDDLFLSSQNNFNDAVLIFSQFEFFWRAMCHIKAIASIDDKMLANIAKSDCKELFVGIESGSSAILNKIHKTDDINIIIKSVQRALISGIDVKGYFICGFPNEKSEDLEKTLELAKNLTKFAKDKKVKFRNSTFQFRPYYGTDLYDEIAKTKNIPYNSILTLMKTSEKINNEIRNKSFNFDSGNYSSVSDDVLHKYIKKMSDLNV
jgi:radical SAM superfamily enzyme YgiQ (UPF0313 family)